LHVDPEFEKIGQILVKVFLTSDDLTVKEFEFILEIVPKDQKSDPDSEFEITESMLAELGLGRLGELDELNELDTYLPERADAPIL
jgi:hypothetical protein